jgi:hypothetical protein
MRAGYNATSVISGHMKTAQTQRETLFFINVIFAKLKLMFNCFAL